MTTNKPNTKQAMADLLTQMRAALPFHLSPAELCQNSCMGCPKKLMEYIAVEVEDWEARLAEGERPTLGDISKLARSGKKIRTVMQANKLL